MNKGIVFWFKKEAYDIGDCHAGTMTIDKLIKNLEEAKADIGGDSKVFIGEYDGSIFGKITAMRITEECYINENDEE